MTNKLNMMIAVVVVALLLLFNSLYVVNERQIAVITQFERLISTTDKAGIKLKLPFVHQVEFFDARIQRLDVDPELFLTNEKKYLIVDYFVEWRVANMRVFYTSVQGNFSRASNLLDQLVKDGLRGEFVRRSVKEVISEDRGSIMQSVTQSLSQDANRYGVEIVGVRLKRVDFSDDIRDRVFERMRAERERVSKNLRAQGREKSQIIMASADREASELVAKAIEKARIIEGEADAKAAELYAKSYGQDLEFYRFWRSMEAYRNHLSDNTVMLVEPEGDFFKYLNTMEIDEQAVREMPSSASSRLQESTLLQETPAISPRQEKSPLAPQLGADIVSEQVVVPLAPK